MNRLKGTIRKITSANSMSFVEVGIEGDTFCAFLLETPETCSYLREGGDIFLVFKETEVPLAKDDLSGRISIRNRFSGRIRAMAQGKILTEVEIDYRGTPVRSVISTQAARELGLKLGDEVWWLLKSSELSLMED